MSKYKSPLEIVSEHFSITRLQRGYGVTIMGSMGIEHNIKMTKKDLERMKEVCLRVAGHIDIAIQSATPKKSRKNLMK